MNLDELKNEIGKLSLKEKHVLAEELRKMLSTGDRENNKSDLIGKIGEAFFDTIVDETIITEVKTEDGKYLETRKVYVETLQYSAYSKKIEESGLMSTNSHLWVTVLLKDNKPHCAIINHTEWLKDNQRKLEKYAKHKPKTKRGSETYGLAIPLNVMLGLEEI